MCWLLFLVLYFSRHFEKLTKGIKTTLWLTLAENLPPYILHLAWYQPIAAGHYRQGKVPTLRFRLSTYWSGNMCFLFESDVYSWKRSIGMFNEPVHLHESFSSRLRNSVSRRERRMRMNVVRFILHWHIDILYIMFVFARYQLRSQGGYDELAACQAIPAGHTHSILMFPFKFPDTDKYLHGFCFETHIEHFSIFACYLGHTTESQLFGSHSSKKIGV